MVRLDVIIFRLISSSLIRFMVSTMATSRRRMDNFSSTTNKFSSPTRWIQALSIGVKLEPNISLKRQESSQPKKSMFFLYRYL